MNTTLIILLVIGIVSICLGVLLFINFASPTGSSRDQMRNLVSSQRVGEGGNNRKGGGIRSFGDADLEEKLPTKRTSELTLEKKLKYARWKLPVIGYRAIQIVISLFAFSIAASHFNVGIQMFSLMTGPIVMGSILNIFVDRRFKKFDADYPQFLLSLVGLLKTGMNPIQGLDAASQGLDEASLVRSEVQIMLERLRLGVTEEKSIGSFGEDVYHPEIELFVQALLLSRRVGGNLSDTLERLAKQVRRRQYFRSSAVAAVGLQRGSIWFILAILAALQGYLFYAFPEAILGSLAHPIGWQIWQAAFIMVMVGMLWIKQVTKIKV